LRKLALIGLTVAVALVAAAVALAQNAEPTITSMSGKVKPKKAGTKKKPKNTYLHIKFSVNKESFSTLRRIEYTIAKTLKISGAGFPTCSADTLGAEGPDSCPKGSLVGKGAATALLGPTQAPLNFEVKIFVGGKKQLNLYLTNPTLSTVFPAKIKNGKLGFDIPESVQNPTGGPNGPYSYVTSVTADLGKQKGIPAESKGHFLVSSVGCKNKSHKVSVKGFLANNPDPPSKPTISKSTKVACK
jgi:hypothetical protein